MAVEPSDIEDTSDWLGCPTELQTCRHFLRMYENEVQELTLQMRKAREDIFGLVQMHADVSTERDHLRAELNRTRADLSDARRQATEIETKSNWELMAMNKLVSQLYDEIQHLTGDDPRLKLPRR